ncbi:MAG: redoxin domain-containing protein [Deltaproteobacteria bacterium]|nr:redoxin domain-containing protein [Deltaproteobacteria bacterium]
MKLAVVSLLAVMAQVSLAVYQVGDSVAEMCWQTEMAEKAVCLGEPKDSVKVLIYNSGWCPGCNRELHDLALRVSEFSGQPVAFYSLSAEGWTRGVPADAKFLNEWRAKHHIPFPVAISPRDVGKKFFEPPIYIPNIAVIDRQGRLAFKAIEPSIDELFVEIRKLL